MSPDAYTPPMFLFAFTAFMGAFLLFVVQPLAAKAVLPTLGGMPFVWNGCMVFFQAALLGGYAYAHVLSRIPRVPIASALHLALLALAMLCFPIVFSGPENVSAAEQPLGWLLLTLTTSVGIPFFLISATAPLTQTWFAAAHPNGRSPYPLYAASNAGSFAALLAYPALIEPFLPMADQTTLLLSGYAVLLCGFVCMGWKLRQNSVIESHAAPAKSAAIAPAPTLTQIIHWMAIAFVPASLLYGITTYITTDLASVPLFWVIPLALYLLTFIFAFRENAALPSIWRALHRVGAPLMALLTINLNENPLIFAPLHLLIFFTACYACHARLAETRPAAVYLTRFYLAISAGGVLGGLFNTFLAYHLFNTIAEYPLMLILSLVAANAWFPHRIDRRFLLTISFTLICYGLLWNYWLSTTPKGTWQATSDVRITLLLSALPIILVASLREAVQPARYMLWIAPLILIIFTLSGRYLHHSDLTFQSRNLFGISRVYWDEGRKAWQYNHGTTLHGLQHADPAKRLKPVSYYAALGPVFDAAPPDIRNAPIGAVGMGVGTVACYGRKGQAFDFFEINPAVEHIARDSFYFTYLKDCPPDIRVVLGDGRISLAREPDGRYGMLIMDAFSSDTIPTHLLTQEALALYMRKITPGGIVAIHISNRHLKLLPVVTATAQTLSVSGVRKYAVADPKDPLILDANWVVLTHDFQTLRTLQKQGWKDLPPTPSSKAWRDDYADVLSTIQIKW